jgi:hypothetical protein
VNRSDGDPVIARTQAWVEQVVIGLELCPFARTVQARGQLRYVHSEATDADGLLQALSEELHLLAAADPASLETTLLIHPRALVDFLDYNDFLDAADGAVAALGYEGVLQVASFHPDYQFEGTRSDDVTNATNRSPYPTLHLLREASVDRAVQAFGDTGQIYRSNVRTLQALGQEGWARLQTRIRDAGSDAGQAGYPPGAEGHHSVRPSSS